MHCPAALPLPPPHARTRQLSQPRRGAYSGERSMAANVGRSRYSSLAPQLRASAEGAAWGRREGQAGGARGGALAGRRFSKCSSSSRRSQQQRASPARPGPPRRLRSGSSTPRSFTSWLNWEASAAPVWAGVRSEWERLATVLGARTQSAHPPRRHRRSLPRARPPPIVAAAQAGATAAAAAPDAAAAAAEAHCCWRARACCTRGVGSAQVGRELHPASPPLLLLSECKG